MGYQAIFNKITHASSLIEPSYKTTFQETALQRQLKQTQTLLSDHPPEFQPLLSKETLAYLDL